MEQIETSLPADTSDLVSTNDREQRFIENLATRKSIKQAAIDAGYSIGYASGDIYHKVKSPKFISKLRSHYNGVAASLLPSIINAEAKVIDIVAADPEQLPKFRHTLRELKQSAGVLSPDVSVVNQTLNYVDLRGTLTRARVDQDAIDVTPGN